jgi:hypothetical protein
MKYADEYADTASPIINFMEKNPCQWLHYGTVLNCFPKASFSNPAQDCAKKQGKANPVTGCVGLYCCGASSIK